jgi:hypothetical protein
VERARLPRTATSGPDALHVNGDSASDSIGVSCAAGVATDYDVSQEVHDTITDSGVTTVVADPPASGTTPVSSVEVYVVTLLYGSSNDSFDSHAYSGRVVVKLQGGNDTFLGGVGNDHVDAGSGNDNVDPGGGVDQVFAGDGADTITSRDGVADLVDCGAGTDTVTADRVDVLVDCENVSLPAPETGKIAGPKKVAKGAKAKFTFTSPVAGASFECQVDKGAFKSCRSPFKLATKKLKVGKHKLLVRAVQPAGNADPSPAAFSFKVTAR